MKRLLVAAALAPLSFAAIAHAQTTVSTGTTAPLVTSTAGDVTVTSAGSVAPATTADPVVAITINSNNSVDNEGSISLTETTTGDSTNQGITNGPFANGGNRTGIQVAGAGPFNANITNGGNATITVIGENSQGIAVLTGLNGFIDDAGTITITGGNVNGNVTSTDVSYGVFSASNAPISGNVTLGTINAKGANATGAALNGGVGGQVEVTGAITATGFRDTAAPVTPSVLAALTPDQLAIGGPALSIGGNVAGGISIDAPVAASGNVTATTGGSLIIFGSAPALLIGGANPITIGAGNNTYGLTIGGAISAAGTYPDVNGAAIQIGGTNPLIVTSGGTLAFDPFSTVTVTGGLDITGSVQATAVAETAGKGAVTGLEIGNGATVPRINVSGSLQAIGANTMAAGDAPPGDVTAILIDPGATVGSTVLNNSGTLGATVEGLAGTAGVTNSAGGLAGNAVVIRDNAGALSELINTGNITAAITPAVAGTPSGQKIAIYENNTNAVTVEQCIALDSGGNCLPTGNASLNAANMTIAPNITGDVDFVGTGNATLNLWGGNLTGAVAFGNNTGNVFDIENGGLAKGGLSVATGGALALNVNDGELFQTAVGNVSLSSLHIGSTGSVIFTGDPLNPSASTFLVAGNATLDTGAAVGLVLLAPLTTLESFTVIQAGNLSASGVSTSLLGQIPFLETGNITTTPTTLTINVSPKTAAQLGLNPAETAEFAAFNHAFGSDAGVAADVLSKIDRPSLIRVYDQFLPDYSGGPFETLLASQREIASAEGETPVKLQTDAVRGWVQEIGVINHEANSPQVNGYNGQGFGVAAGIERARGDTSIGLSASFITTGVVDQTQPSAQSLSASAFEVGAYWRKGGGEHGVTANASVNGGFVTLGSHRFLIDQTNTDDLQSTASQIVSREAKASWMGGVVAVNVGLGYQFGTGRFYARPEVSADYVALLTSAYKEHGGGSAFDLNVRSQTASQGDAQADIVLGMNFGQSILWRPELTLGYRAVVVGGPAATTANFVGGQSFTINPSFPDKGGFLAKLGVRASGQYSDFSAAAGGEFGSGYQTYDAHAAARFLF